MFFVGFLRGLGLKFGVRDLGSCGFGFGALCMEGFGASPAQGSRLGLATMNLPGFRARGPKILKPSRVLKT